MELSIEFYQAYDRGSELLKGDNPDADLIEYMKEEGFGPAKGVTMKSRFHSTMAKQLEIDSKTIPKKVLGGFFLYNLVSSYGRGVLLLLQDNALRLWTEVIPKGRIPVVLHIVSEDFSELADICQGLDYYVNDEIKMGVAPILTFKYDAPSFTSIFIATEEKGDGMTTGNEASQDWTNRCRNGMGE
ncbi:hypothetical protein VF21_05593 [Pseudogymnoascus sp. 05NY08]|nr:hypothetical protein VF21_05593 [Pseudogymnoascus sp. 05NY08]